MTQQRRLMEVYKAGKAQAQLTKWSYATEVSLENQFIMIKCLVAEASRRDFKTLGSAKHDEERSVMWYRRWFHIMHGVSSDIVTCGDADAIKAKLSKISMFQPTSNELVVDYFSDHGNIAKLRARQDKLLRDMCRDGELFHSERESTAAQ
jgi:hypothetical protein